jgi:hypothetical protein
MNRKQTFELVTSRHLLNILQPTNIHQLSREIGMNQQVNSTEVTAEYLKLNEPSNIGLALAKNSLNSHAHAVQPT